MQDFRERIEGKNILLVVEQKGSDEVECKERVDKGCSIFNKLKDRCKYKSLSIMVVGGANNGVPAEKIYEWVGFFGIEGAIVANKAGNTHEKGVAIADYVVENNIEVIIQVTSLYHSLRAYLTTSRSLNDISLSKDFHFFNFVADSGNSANIQFAILDEIFLAKYLDTNVRFEIERLDFDKYVACSHEIIWDEGLEKHIYHRQGESARLSEYSENGKDHLMTRVSLQTILKTYLYNELI